MSVILVNFIYNRHVMFGDFQRKRQLIVFFWPRSSPLHQVWIISTLFSAIKSLSQHQGKNEVSLLQPKNDRTKGKLTPCCQSHHASRMIWSICERGEERNQNHLFESDFDCFFYTQFVFAFPWIGIGIASSDAHALQKDGKIACKASVSASYSCFQCRGAIRCVL